MTLQQLIQKAKGNISILGAIIIAILTMVGSIVSAQITASSTSDKKNSIQDIKIESLQTSVASVASSLENIQNDVKIVKCAVIGRNDMKIFDECKILNQ